MMFIKQCFFRFAIVSLFTFIFSIGLCEDKKPQNIILIGWDGAQRNHIKECLAKNELPNLQKLSKEGIIVNIDITRVTDTKAGWTQILTGYEPEVTGVFNNSKYQPIPEGYTVFERLEKQFPKDFMTIAVIGKKEHVDNEGPKKIFLDDEGNVIEPNKKNAQKKNENKKNKMQKNKQETMKQGKKQAKLTAQGKTIEENGKKYLLLPGKPYFNASKNMDIFINGLQKNDRVSSQTLALLEKYKDKPFFFFVHFAEIDHSGHQFGENSKESNDAYISCDKFTGEIISKLKELNLYDKTLIYVTADHGFDEGQKQHTDAPYVFLATNDKKVERSGRREDIAPTILARFGVDLSKINPPLAGHPLTEKYNPPLWQ